VLRVTARQHRRAAAVCVSDTGHRACCLERPPWCSPPLGSACPRHAPCSEACRLESRLDAALVLAPLAPAVRHAVEIVSSSSRLEAARLLPPPCTLQYGVPLPAAALVQPSFWQRLPPPCALQCHVRLAAALSQPSFWQRLPPPCAMHRSVSPWCSPPAHTAAGVGAAAVLLALVDLSLVRTAVCGSPPFPRHTSNLNPKRGV
jgi:hypothetical protein